MYFLIQNKLGEYDVINAADATADSRVISEHRTEHGAMQAQIAIDLFGDENA